jgi:sugar transferase (PEP-CTERM system associated)
MLATMRYIRVRKLYLLIGDLIILLGLLNAVVIARLLPNSFMYLLSPSMLAVPIVLGLYVLNMYSVNTNPYSFKYVIHYIIAGLLGIALLLFFMLFTVGEDILSDYWFILTFTLLVIVMYGWRLVYHQLLKIVKPRKVLIVGAGKVGERLSRGMDEWCDEYNVVGFIDDAIGKVGTLVNGIKVLGGSDKIATICEQYKANTIVVAIMRDKSEVLVKNLLSNRMEGRLIYDSPSFLENLTRKVPVETLDDHWFVSTTLHGVRKGLYTVLAKRLLDVVAAVLGLILSLPIIIISTLLVKLDSKGPAFYKQKRVGQNGRVFVLCKFRSMYQGAEQNGAVWASSNDDRVTRFGRLLRKFRIDELPQLWNVLRGDMSVVGPRPERPEFVDKLAKEIPYYSLRHVIKPGITGWAQINYRYGASTHDAIEKLKYELFYIKNMSLLLDIYIMIRTIRVVLFREGAR